MDQAQAQALPARQGLQMHTDLTSAPHQDIYY
jgi:hypothetical protein